MFVNTSIDHFSPILFRSRESPVVIENRRERDVQKHALWDLSRSLAMEESGLTKRSVNDAPPVERTLRS